MTTAAVLAVVIAVSLIQGREGTVDDAVREVVKATFARLDKDSDGAWSQDEMTMETNGLDKNGDGLILWEEYKNDLETNRNEPFSNFAPSSIMEELEKVVARCVGNKHGFTIPSDLQWTDTQPWLDTDGDGALSEDEFVNFHMKVMELNIKGSNKCPQDEA